MTLFPPRKWNNVHSAPLAEKLRPKSLDEVVGQQDLIGTNKPLRKAAEQQQAVSMILWGPPGTGKTSLAYILANAFSENLITLSAVNAGVKEIRQAIEQAKVDRNHQKKTILFIDEIHRFNKTQQDTLLPHIESGLIVLLGATTENPSFEIISALLSRVQVYTLKPLTDADMKSLLEKGRQFLSPDLIISESAKNNLIYQADHDARRLLNFYEQVINTIDLSQTQLLDDKLLADFSSSAPKYFDKYGDTFYDQISALHKTVRGSNPDAALYWLCRMLNSGTDPHYLARRIIRISWEDIGLADPRAIEIAINAAQTYDRLGSPEGELALGQAVIYLALAPKSNAGYTAFNKATEYVQNMASHPVPNHLRNAPTKLMKNQKIGKGYRYAHSEEYAYAANENYFPDNMPAQSWYKPEQRGLEIKLAEKMQFLKELDKQAKDKHGKRHS